MDLSFRSIHPNHAESDVISRIEDARTKQGGNIMKKAVVTLDIVGKAFKAGEITKNQGYAILRSYGLKPSSEDWVQKVGKAITGVVAGVATAGAANAVSGGKLFGGKSVSKPIPELPTSVKTIEKDKALTDLAGITASKSANNILESIKDSRAFQAAEKVYSQLPESVRQNLKAKGGEILRDVTNGRISAELLPKTAPQKQLENVVAYNQRKSVMAGFNLSDPVTLIVVVLIILVILGMIFKAK